MTFSTAVIKSEYLPPISTFWAIQNSEKVIIEVHENYQKKSTRNRAKILGVNKVEILSVPLRRGKNSKMPILDVQISYEDQWQGKHLHSIRSAYGNSPYFEYYFEDIKRLIASRYDALYDMNTALLSYFIQSLSLECELIQSSEYHRMYNESHLDLRHIPFNSPDIEGYAPKKYNQVFEEKHGFVSDISILDLLMCKGPESILYL